MYDTTTLNWGGQRTRIAYCQTGFQLSDPFTAPFYCVPRADLKNLGYCPSCSVTGSNAGSNMVGHPINVGTGNLYDEEIDYQGSGAFPLAFRHTYNSGGPPLGQWRHNFQSSIVLGSSGTQAWAYRPDGKVFRYTLSGSQWIGHTDVNERLAGSGTSGWTYTTANDEVESYDASGRLLSIRNRAGITQTLSYDSSNRLASVSDPFGHTLTFAYNASNQISQMTDPAGGMYVYTYDTAGLNNLLSIQYPNLTTRTFSYGNAQFVSAVTGVVDEASVTYVSASYDSSGRATSTSLSGGADAATISYGNGTAPTVTDALGKARTYYVSPVVGTVKVSGVSEVCAGCAYSLSFDSRGNVSNNTDFVGHSTGYTYDLTRNLETFRTEASGTARARTIATLWSSTYRIPTSISVYAGGSATGTPLRSTAYTYDSSGNTLTKTVTDPAAGTSRTWTYTYDSYGRALTVDGPRTDVSDVTTYTYYTCTTGYQCGEVQTVTDAAGNITTYNTYNAHGQPLTITDPNGVVTTLTYDARQRLTSRQVGTDTTSFVYWPTGLLKKVTLPDGSYLLYSYDGAHRLTQISDGLGNSIDYTLDGMGNRTAENVYDPSNTLHRTHSRVFNTLNQLYKDVNAAGTAAVTTTFGYDAQGSQTSIAAPLTRNAGNAYDELNRLKQITDPANGITKFGYDANDNLTSVTDPRNLVTSYGYNGLGDLRTQSSPDTGSTTNTYDSGGNLATSTDARGAVATYSYDALNRATSVAYSLSGSADQTVSFTYDFGTNGKGHLTGASDASHSMSWGYDTLGRVLSKSQTVAGVTHSVAYSYTNGNLTSLTSPSGQSISYGYNSNHQVTSIAVNGTTVLNSVTYEPLGPVSGWTWGNSTTTSRTYDTDGKISQIVSNGTKGFGYDDAFRITGITDTSAGSANWTYGYDALDRITSGGSATVTRGWTYDANGNRLTETGSAPSTYSISSSSNRITGITGALARTYGYDAAGNTLSYATATATYNNAGRLKTVSQGGSTETLVYNALGQRIEKTGGSAGTALYWYDEAGHLLGEYDGSGNLIEETVWLGDIPVATLQPNGSGVSIYYVHTDQLNTPRQITRPSDNAQMWTWFSDPFGTDAANANPAGMGIFTYNLRFPGQIFDGQAGLHYNDFRDYDPASGRYVESDPIGLRGGLNTYAYVGSSPVNRFDTLGLIACGDWGWMAIDWALGTTSLNRALGNDLPRNRSYGAETDQTAQVRGLPPIQTARDRYRTQNASALNSGCCGASKLKPWQSTAADNPGHFGPRQFVWATINQNCAWHFLGSFSIRVDPISCSEARFTVTNLSGRESFFRFEKYLDAKSLPPNVPTGFGANFSQTYSWTESF